MTSAKAAIITLLTDTAQKVHVDPGARGAVINHWPNDADFSSNEWVISVGPVVGADAQIASLGSFSKLIWEHIQVDIWLMEKRNKDYTTMEKMRSDLVQDVDRCLLHFSASPGTGFMHVNASGWRELDEVGRLRSSMTIEILYEKVRT